ncbi:hypothetical protein CXZ10_14485 [Pleomorphomonas diazotrophica]|uniref:Uncharacterized protein n=1 Tax=Pleomorphomonas diazotrophica TaxID=1166257 RepID=A0A2N3LVD3_9HYPH|nr:hypothetical protein CXZ10_14485 [Pleomorphomonas diazotrophica]
MLRETAGSISDEAMLGEFFFAACDQGLGCFRRTAVHSLPPTSWTDVNKRDQDGASDRALWATRQTVNRLMKIVSLRRCLWALCKSDAGA